MSQSADQLIFSQGNVSVSRALVRIGGDTYSVSSIGSVFIRYPTSPFLYSAAVVTGILAVIALFMLFNDPGQIITLILFCAISGLCVFAARRKQARLFLRTASGDHPILQNRNRAFLQQIKAGIEQALISRV